MAILVSSIDFCTLTTIVLSALILAVNDMCVHCRTLKYSKRIVLFTDAESETDWADIDIVREKIESNGIQLIIVYVI